MDAIELRDIWKSFGALRVLNGFALDVEQGRSVCLIGPSGCGKSTVLRIIAGLEFPDRGIVRLRGRTVSGDGVRVAPSDRGIGMAFQDFCLWPHLTVEGHLDFVLKSCRMTRGARRARIDELLDICQLRDKRQAFPGDLSGGQQQRVGFARAIACRPPILLLDEPFSNLDPDLRSHLVQTLQHLKTDLGTTMLMATHDQSEAEDFGEIVRLA